MTSYEWCKVVLSFLLSCDLILEIEPAAPDPPYHSVLSMQADHRSSLLWDVQVGAVLFADKTSSQVQLLYLTLLDAPWERTEEYRTTSYG